MVKSKYGLFGHKRCLQCYKKLTNSDEKMLGYCGSCRTENREQMVAEWDKDRRSHSDSDRCICDGSGNE